MKKRVILLLTLMAAIAIVPAEAKKREKNTPEQKGILTINRPTAEAHVGFLASDALKGRESGTEHGHIAGEYLIAVLKQMGATPLFGNDFAHLYFFFIGKKAGFDNYFKDRSLMHTHTSAGTQASQYTPKELKK